MVAAVTRVLVEFILTPTSEEVAANPEVNYAAKTEVKVFSNGDVQIEMTYPDQSVRRFDTTVVELRAFQTVTHIISEVVNGRIPTPTAHQSGVTSVGADAPADSPVRPNGG